MIETQVLMSVPNFSGFFSIFQEASLFNVGGGGGGGVDFKWGTPHGEGTLVLMGGGVGGKKKKLWDDVGGHHMENPGACGSAGPNQSQTNKTTELWVSYSVKSATPKHVANIAHII